MLLVAQQSLVVIRHEGLTHVDSSLYTEGVECCWRDEEALHSMLEITTQLLLNVIKDILKNKKENMLDKFSDLIQIKYPNQLKE